MWWQECHLHEENTPQMFNFYTYKIRIEIIVLLSI